MITVNYRYPITGVTDFSAQLFLEGVAVGSPETMTALTIEGQPSGYTADFVGVNNGEADEVQVSSVSQGFGEALSLSQTASVDLGTMPADVAAIKVDYARRAGDYAATGDAMALTTGERTALATSIWTRSTRTLSSFGTLASDVWSATTRTLSAFGFDLGFATPQNVIDAKPDLALIAKTTDLTGLAKVTDLDGIATSGNVTASTTTITNALNSLPAPTVDLGNIPGDIADIKADYATYMDVDDSTQAITDALDNLPDPTVNFTGIATIENQNLIRSDISGLNTGSGSGAYSVVVNVTDGANSLENATVRLSEGANSFTAKTDINGDATFALDATTYNIAVTKSGYQLTPTTIVVDAAHLTFTKAMAAVTIPAPAHAGTSIIYANTRTETGELDNIEVSMMLMEAAPVIVSGGYECSFKQTKKSGQDDPDFSGEAATKGQVRFICYPGKKYKIWSSAAALNKTVLSPVEGTAENIVDLVQV